MRTIFLFILLLPKIFSFSFFSSENIASTILDNVPIIGNIKNFGEAVTGKDMVTDEELSTGERIFSFFASIPGFNFFKNKKHLKNSKKFFDAVKRAKILNKMKNYFKFTKAGERAAKKANFAFNVANKMFKSAKEFFKNFRN